MSQRVFEETAFKGKMKTEPVLSELQFQLQLRNARKRGKGKRKRGKGTRITRKVGEKRKKGEVVGKGIGFKT